MTLPSRARAALALLLVAAAGGCGRGDGRPRSVLLVTLDTTRADALGAFGGPRGVTPNLDALAAESVLYTYAHTVTPLTLPAHASMLTGLYPLRHGVRENGLWALPEEASTLAERARGAGYRTAAFLAAVVLERRFGLAQGFDVYDAPDAPAVEATTHPAERSGPEVVALAERWLRARDRARPFFLWVHLFDPHGPLQAPPELVRRAGGNPYLGEVAHADQALGTLLRTLRDEDLLDSTWVVVVADHGEALGEHGEPAHGAFAYESTLRVPLLVRHPDGARAGERDASVVSVVDVFPTLLEAMGLPRDPDADGTSLCGAGPPAERGVYFEAYAGFIAYGWSQLAGWLDARGKYVHSSRPELFDPRADPGETRDLVAERAGELERYRAAIAALARRPALEARAAGVDAELSDALRALGYAGVGSALQRLPDPLAPSDRPSPASRMAEHRRALRAMELANQGRLEEAAAELALLAQAAPDDYFVLDRLGDALKRLKRYREAIAPLARVANEGPAWSYSLFTLGICLLETDRHDEALAAFRRALAADPGLARTVAAMLETLRRRGDDALAERYASLLGG